jgi:MscS family membrane protein
MTMSLRRFFLKAAIPLVCTFLVVLFITLQFFATPRALGSLQFLTPAETSSPRATLEDFRANTSRAAAMLLEAYKQNKSEPGLSWSPSVREKVAEADALLARASRSLDLRNVPPIELEHRRLEATLLLKEVLDRVPLPDPGTIPGLVDVASKPIPSWNVPGTEIKIVRVSDGPRTGEYLVSSETVQRLDEFYHLIRNQPNLSGSTEDFYDFFSQSPGRLLPPKWYGLIEALPASFRHELQGQAIWQWIGFSLVLVLAASGVWGARLLVRHTAPESSAAVSLAAHAVVPGAIVVAALFVRYMADNHINLTGRVSDLVEEILQGVAYMAMIWGILRFSNALAERLTFSMSEGIDAHLARAAVRISGIALALVLLIYGASYLGIPLAGLLAGLGVGGLAVALAAKPTIENFIGGLILYADRPVRVGDLCRVGSLEGRVEEIGLRSTRIRGLDRTLITIPNATFVNMNIINLTNRDRMPYERIIGLHSTDSAAIRHEIEDIAAFVARHPKIESGSVKARLREGQEEKPKVEICALLLTSKWDDFLQIQQEIDLLLRDKILASKASGESASPDAGNVYPLKDPAEAEKIQATLL